MNFYTNLSFAVCISYVAFVGSIISSEAVARPVETIIPTNNFINGTCLSVLTNGSCIQNQTLNNSSKFNSTFTNNTSQLLNTSFSNTTIHNSTCEMCMGLVGFIKADLNIANESVANITHFIDIICSRISGPTAKECVLVSRSIEKVVSEIDHGLNVSEVCHSLGMC